MAILLGSVVHIVEHTAHELLELAVDLLKGPGKMLSVLAHLEARYKHAAGVSCLTRHEDNTVGLEVLGGIDRSGHVCTLAHNLAAIGNQSLGILKVKSVLTSAGQCDVAGKLPHAATVALVPGSVRTLIDVHSKAHALIVTGALLVVDTLEHGVVDAVGILDPALSVRASQNLAAQLGNLLHSIDSNIAGTVNNNVLALEGVTVALKVLVNKVRQAVAGGLGTSERAAKAQAFARKDARPLVAQALILTKQVSDLAATNTQVTGGIQLGHEGLTEMHDLVVGLALGVEVGTSLAAAHGKGGQRVLKDLLEAQELEHAQRNGGVKAQAALVGSNRRVELNAVTTVDLNLARIVDPGNAEHNDALGLDETLENGGLLVLGMSIESGLQGAQNLSSSLDEFGLLRVTSLEVLEDRLGVAHVSLQS